MLAGADEDLAAFRRYEPSACGIALVLTAADVGARLALVMHIVPLTRRCRSFGRYMCFCSFAAVGLDRLITAGRQSRIQRERDVRAAQHFLDHFRERVGRPCPPCSILLETFIQRLASQFVGFLKPSGRLLRPSFHLQPPSALPFSGASLSRAARRLFDEAGEHVGCCFGECGPSSRAPDVEHFVSDKADLAQRAW